MVLTFFIVLSPLIFYISPCRSSNHTATGDFFVSIYVRIIISAALSQIIVVMDVFSDAEPQSVHVLLDLLKFFALSVL